MQLRDRHIGELVSRLASDTSALVRLELDLAKAELQETANALRDELTATWGVAREETPQKLGDARADLGRRAKNAGGAAAMFGAAGLAALLALGALTACLVLFLDRFLARDLAALIVAVGWTLVAATAGLRGRDKARGVGRFQAGRLVPRRTIAALKGSLETVGDVKAALPEQTIQTAKEDVAWLKTRGKSDAR